MENDVVRIVVGRAWDVRVKFVRECHGKQELVPGRHVGGEPGVGFVDDLDGIDLRRVEEGASEVVKDIGVSVRELVFLEVAIDWLAA